MLSFVKIRDANAIMIWYKFRNWMAPIVWQEYKEKWWGHKTETVNQEHIGRVFQSGGFTIKILLSFKFKCEKNSTNKKKTKYFGCFDILCESLRWKSFENFLTSSLILYYFFLFFNIFDETNLIRDCHCGYFNSRTKPK